MLAKPIQQKILEEKCNGKTAGQLAIKYGVHENTVYNICKLKVKPEAKRYFEQRIRQRFMAVT